MEDYDSRIERCSIVNAAREFDPVGMQSAVSETIRGKEKDNEEQIVYVSPFPVASPATRSESKNERS